MVVRHSGKNVYEKKIKDSAIEIITEESQKQKALGDFEEDKEEQKKLK